MQEPGDAGGLSPVDIPQDGTIVTKDQAAAKVTESSQAYSQLMDQMEASRAQKGDYFITFGEKTGEEDNRVLLLTNNGIFGGSGVVYIAVTREGPMSASTDHMHTPGGIAKELKETEIENSVLEPSDLANVFGVVKADFKNGDKTSILLFRLANPEDTEGLFSSAMDRSIAAAEVPHKETFDTTQKDINLANTMAERLRQLPPKA